MPGSQQGSWRVHDSSDGVCDSDPVVAVALPFPLPSVALKNQRRWGGGGDENMKEEEKGEEERAIGVFWNV